MDFEDYLKMATPWFDKVLAGKGMDYRRLAELMQSRTDIFSRIPEKIAFLAEMPDYDTAIFFNKKQKSDENVAKEVLPLLLPAGCRALEGKRRRGSASKG
jgi:glutamyl-tRNA synthetase